MLYALADHDVMENLLPGIREQYISTNKAVKRLQSQPGLVPVAINPSATGLIYFADIGTTPLLEWKYIYTIERLAGENAIGEIFSTDLELLTRDDLAIDGVAPDGLVFHVSRCGSTLFTKALSRSPRNIIINQGGPLQEGFWAAITDHWQHPPEINARNIRMLQNLVVLMARRRRPEYQRCFVKLISWNIIYLDLISAAFPAVPALYLYRDPVEVIATVLQETTAVLRAKGQAQAYGLTGCSPSATAGMSDVEYLARCYAHYFKLVFDKSDSNELQLVNYKQLKHAESFAEILERGFNLQLDEAELEQMREQYLYYSKDDSDTTIFKGDADSMFDILPAGGQMLIKEICDESLAQLDSSGWNLFPSQEVEP